MRGIIKLKKKSSRAIIFATAILLIIGVLNYSEIESKVNATNQKVIVNSKLVSVNPPNQSLKTKETVKVDSLNSETHPAKQEPQKKTETVKTPDQQTQTESETKKVTTQTQNEMPDIKVIDGDKYVNLMSRAEENLIDLVNIAKKHDATLYAIEYSDCFAMFDNTSNQVIMMFSTGSRSVSVENVEILYDMHPYIKEQIKSVVETGKEANVKIGEYESYLISKVDGRIRLSF